MVKSLNWLYPMSEREEHTLLLEASLSFLSREDTGAQGRETTQGAGINVSNNNRGFVGQVEDLGPYSEDNKKKPFEGFQPGRNMFKFVLSRDSTLKT